MHNVLSKETELFLVVQNKSPADMQKFLDGFSENKFDTYLKSVSNYSSSEYHTGICYLFAKYQKSYSDLNECSAKNIEITKHYSNVWATELINKFGADYISRNIESVKNLIVNMDQKVFSKSCIDVEKEGLYSEIQYIITVREYFQFYLEFYNSLDKKEQKLYADKEKTAKDVLKIVSEYPFQIIMYGHRLGADLKINNNVSLKPEVIEFMVNHHELSKPFNPVIAFKDVLKACGKPVNSGE
jgi:hypothetical protein